MSGSTGPYFHALKSSSKSGVPNFARCHLCKVKELFKLHGGYWIAAPILRLSLTDFNKEIRNILNVCHMSTSNRKI